METINGNTKELNIKRMNRKFEFKLKELKKSNERLGYINGILDDVVVFGLFGTAIHAIFSL